MLRTPEDAMGWQLEELARDVGRLRRRAEPESSLAFLADRMADRVETLDAIVRPCAAELHRAGVPVERALEHVDRRRDRLRTLLATAAA